MTVVADTSPLNYLVQIGFEDLLQHLYKSILVPRAVMDELQRAGAPARVRAWASQPPPWLRMILIAGPPLAELASLDPGEREAIQLADERRAQLLLMDERKGRVQAERRGLEVTGTLGVLLQAGVSELVDPEVLYRRLLAETNFRISAILQRQFLSQIQ